MADTILTYEAYTSGAGQKVTKFSPLRLAVTGSNHGRVARCTGGEDADVIGVAKENVLTIGFAVPVISGYGDRFQGNVNTTVAAGAKVECGPGGVYRAAGATAGVPYVARVIQARTNAGQCWLMFVPNGKV